VLMRAVRLATHCEHPVQRDERLLIFALHRDGVNAGAAIGFEKRLAVGAVGLAPATVRPHVMRRQQNHVEAAAEEKPPPEVRARAGLHDDAARRNGAQNLSNCARESRFRSRMAPVRPTIANSNTFLARSTAIVTVDMGGLLSFEHSGFWRFQSTRTGGVHSTH
jgi:hypothetical protein